MHGPRHAIRRKALGWLIIRRAVQSSVVVAPDGGRSVGGGKDGRTAPEPLTEVWVVEHDGAPRPSGQAFNNGGDGEPMSVLREPKY